MPLLQPLSCCRYSHWYPPSVCPLSATHHVLPTYSALRQRTCEMVHAVTCSLSLVVSGLLSLHSGASRCLLLKLVRYVLVAKSPNQVACTYSARPIFNLSLTLTWGPDVSPTWFWLVFCPTLCGPISA